MESRLVGRHRELGIVDRAIDAVQGGDGRVLLVSGQAGIGKSRLAISALHKAKDHGFAVLMGSSSPLQAGLAYAPVVEALRRHLGSLPEPESARLLDGLHDIAGLIADPRLSPAPLSGDPELERTRMFEAVLRLTGRITARRPALFVVDDLHWADRGTIELLHHLSRGSRRRLLLWFGYRSAEPGGPLAALAMTVRRDDSSVEMALEPLSDNAVGELVGDLLGTRPQDDVLRKVTARAQGVPLFVTALVGGGALRDAAGLPVIVRDVVLDRLQRLDDRARRLLELIAVAGAGGSPRLLRAVWAEDGFDAVLRKLFDQGLIEELVDGPAQSFSALTYRVAHPLYAEVAYAELTVGQRRSLHAAIAAELGPADVLEAAPHYRDAGDMVDPVRASEVLGAAGKRALDVHDAHEAVNYLSVALNHAKAAGRADLVPDLMTDLAFALQASGRLDDAALMWDDADSIAQSAGDTLRQRLLGYYRSMLEAERGHPAELPRPVPFDDDDPPIGLMVHWLVAVRAGDTATMWQALDQMINLARLRDDDLARSVAHFGAGMVARLGLDYAGAHTQNLIALETAELAPPDVRDQYTYTPRLLAPSLALLRGDPAGGVRAADNPGAVSVQVFLPSAVHYVAYVRTFALFAAGDLPGALAVADESLALAERVVGQDRLVGRALAARAFLLVENGDLARAERDLKDARADYDTTYDDFVLAVDLAELAYALRTGAAVDDSAFLPHRPLRDLTVDWLRVAYSGYLAVARKNHAVAQQVLDDLRNGAKTSPFLDALAVRQEGLMLDDPERLDRAAARLAAMGAPLPVPKPGTPPLSKREREIVRLVGAGLTNGQIAERLFLSERTIETHLHNSYKKLRLTTRPALTRWALEHAGD
ncbi:ATP-binding protein [Kutzneria sp. CA-103260]|uniref:ATP-binding protein n=1 Tax=Kutzneria sp. CA-103260 TaxID=2802641 RepID=UPI001BA4D20D|nr:LuxR family transcriptional regulator [Kutzneria sp. CA-103260]QUQ63166.1 HTH-type transcriptional regulator MalT [Kutzneria sp. CA-103260]